MLLTPFAWICFHIFDRHFCITKGGHTGSKCGWNIIVDMGDMRFIVNGWCALLCGIGNIDSSFRWWLCLHFWSIRPLPGFSLSMGCFIHFCVSNDVSWHFLDQIWWNCVRCSQNSPTTNAIMSLTFANYVIQPFFDDCDVPAGVTQLLAALTICKYLPYTLLENRYR